MSEITENHKITDVGAGLVKAIMNTNPITGFVQTIYDEYAGRQWQQRREKWEEVLEEKLQKLKDSVDFNKINSISNFAQILANAGQGAISDIEESKVNLYANTIINTIKNENINNIKTHIFLNMLRKYSLAHIETLMYFHNPSKYASFIRKYNIHGALYYYQSSPQKFFNESNFSYQEGEVEHFIIGDLFSDRLMVVKNYIDTVTLKWSRLEAPITTPIVNEFLQFIEE